MEVRNAEKNSFSHNVIIIYGCCNNNVVCKVAISLFRLTFLIHFLWYLYSALKVIPDKNTCRTWHFAIIKFYVVRRRMSGEVEISDNLPCYLFAYLLFSAGNLKWRWSYFFNVSFFMLDYLCSDDIHWGCHNDKRNFPPRNCIFFVSTLLLFVMINFFIAWLFLVWLVKEVLRRKNPIFIALSTVIIIFL